MCAFTKSTLSDLQRGKAGSVLTYPTARRTGSSWDVLA